MIIGTLIGFGVLFGGLLVWDGIKHNRQINKERKELDLPRKHQ